MTAARKIVNQELREEYISIHMGELMTHKKAPADFFVKLPNDKHTLVVKEGAELNLEKMHLFEKSEWVYVRKSDFKKCVGSTISVAGLIINSESVASSTKSLVLLQATKTVFNGIGHLGFDNQALEHSKMICKSIQTLVENKLDLNSVINMMAQTNDELVRHSMMVSALSVIIAKEMKWVGAQNLEKLALGALLHDVGLKEIPDEILQTPRHAMTRDQTDFYESHVYRGADILRSMPSVSDDIIAMALEHHENSSGHGYPRHLRDVRINPFARVVALADCFSELVVSSVNNPNAKTAEQAVDYIENTLGQPFHKPAFIALKAAILKGK